MKRSHYFYPKIFKYNYFTIPQHIRLCHQGFIVILYFSHNKQLFFQDYIMINMSTISSIDKQADLKNQHVQNTILQLSKLERDVDNGSKLLEEGSTETTISSQLTYSSAEQMNNAKGQYVGRTLGAAKPEMLPFDRLEQLDESQESQDSQSSQSLKGQQESCESSTIEDFNQMMDGYYKLLDKYNSKKSKICQLKDQIKRREKERKRNKKETDILRETIKHNQCEIMKCEINRKNDQQEIKRLKKELEEAQKVNEANCKKIEALKKEIQDKNKEIDDKRKEIEGKKTEIQALKKELQDKNKEIDGKNKEIEGNKSEIQALKKEVEDRQKEIQDNKKDNEAKQNQIDALKKALQQLNKQPCESKSLSLKLFGSTLFGLTTTGICCWLLEMKSLESVLWGLVFATTAIAISK